MHSNELIDCTVYFPLNWEYAQVDQWCIDRTTFHTRFINTYPYVLQVWWWTKYMDLTLKATNHPRGIN